MEENKSFYMDFIQSLKRGFIEVDLEEFKDKKIVLLGTNLTSEFDRFIVRLGDDGRIKKLILQKKMLIHIKNRWDGKFLLHEWNDNYSSKMIKDESMEEAFIDADYLIFFSAHHWNLRDLNIIELGMEFEEKYGGKLCCYDFSEGKLYRYKYIEQYYEGIQLYQRINNYMEKSYESSRTLS